MAVAKREVAGKQLQAIATRLEVLSRRDYGESRSRLDVTPSEDGFRVHWLLNEDAWFAPEGGELIFPEIYRLLASTSVSPWLSALTLEGHEIAANGTIGWEIEPIAYARTRFSRLKVFRLESVAIPDGPCSAGTLEGRGVSDASVATRLLDRMPVLEELAIPSPPGDESFFQGTPHPLRKLSVFDVDYESFVTRLADSRRFPRLEELHITESFRTDVGRRLPVSQYARLLQSSAFPALRAVTFGQIDVTSKQTLLLRGTRIGRQLCCFAVKPAQQWADRPILRAVSEPAQSLRDICGVPFPTVASNRKWRTDTVMSLVHSMRNGGDFSVMPPLADALQEAGCEEEIVLDHCRAEGPHLPGCWVIELLMGK